MPRIVRCPLVASLSTASVSSPSRIVRRPVPVPERETMLPLGSLSDA
jgi:hypothetical protein